MPLPEDGDTTALRESIRLQLLAGEARADVEEVGIPLSTWRSLARRVAHELGRPITTVADEWSARAWFKDWGKTAAEQAISQKLFDEVIRRSLPPDL